AIQEDRAADTGQEGGTKEAAPLICVKRRSGGCLLAEHCEADAYTACSAPWSRGSHRNRIVSLERLQASFLCRSHDGVDRPPLPVFPPAADAAGAALHGDDHHRGRASWRPGAAAAL